SSPKRSAVCLMTWWYCSISSKVQSLGPGSGCAARPFDGLGSCSATRWRRRPPCSFGLGESPSLRTLSPIMDIPSSNGRPFLLEQLAEHRIDLRGLGHLAHRKVRLHVEQLRILFPQVLLFL